MDSNKIICSLKDGLKISFKILIHKLVNQILDLGLRLEKQSLLDSKFKKFHMTKDIQQQKLQRKSLWMCTIQGIMHGEKGNQPDFSLSLILIDKSGGMG